MAASTITRDSWTNDSGTAAVPVGDGTLLANTVLQNHIYARIDAMFAGAGAYTTFTLGGLFSAEGFGTHSFSAGGTGAQQLVVGNTTAGTGNYGLLCVGNDVSSQSTRLYSHSSTFTPIGTYRLADGTTLWANGVGGLSLIAADGAGKILFNTTGTERMRIHASGCISLMNSTDSGAGMFTVSATNITLDSSGILTTTTARLSTGSVGTPSYSFTGITNKGFYSPATDEIGVSILGVLLARFVSTSGVTSSLTFQQIDLGNRIGPSVQISHNSNVSTPSAGNIILNTLGGVGYYVWIDNSGVMRLMNSGVASPTNANDTSASSTIVGTQTSQRATKHIHGTYTDRDASLALVNRTPLYDFEYKNGEYNHTRFVGIVAEDSPEFAMDNGRSFNPVSSVGHLIAAVQALTARLSALEAA